MNATPAFIPLDTDRIPRRVFLLVPALLAGLFLLFHRKQRVPPDAAENGDGPPVALILFSPDGTRHRALIHKLQMSDAEWRRLLDSEQFVITRRGGTELAYTGRDRNNKATGVYRCVCCGNALFFSRDKFDSGTGWPSFTAPAAAENIWTRSDRTLAVERTEVLCRKCDAHIGHVFQDGPSPTGLRYCMNSAALFFFPARIY